MSDHIPTPIVKENRQSFMARLRPFFPPKTMRRIELAYTLSKYGFRAQTRKELDAEGKRIRTFEHMRRVGLILIDEAQVILAEVILAGIQHDRLEDTEDLTAEMIEDFFGSDVVTMIQTLSKIPEEGYLERFYLCNDWRTYLCKACDRLDNMRSLMVPGVDREFQLKQIVETRDKYYPLFDRMVSLTPPEYVERVRRIRDEVRAVTERAAAIYELQTPVAGQ